MRLRNNQESWGAWQPFRSELGWELPRTRGEHTVWVELRSGSRTTTSSDSIILTQDAPAPALGGLPETITFTYSIPAQTLIPGSWTLVPQTGGSNDPLAWAVESDAAWLQLVPTSGTTPQSFSVIPVGYPEQGPTHLTGALTVTVTAPPGVAGSPHRVNVTLEVVDRVVSRVYRPLVAR